MLTDSRAHLALVDELERLAHQAPMAAVTGLLLLALPQRAHPNYRPKWAPRTG